MMAFTKCLLSGIVTVLLIWFVSIIVYATRAPTAAKAGAGQGGPVAIAGGWEYLLHKPLIVTLLTVAFGVGFYLCTRRV
jgi:hypothetical protein